MHPGAVRCENQAQFHPLRLLRALAEELTIWEGTRALEAEGDVTLAVVFSVWPEPIRSASSTTVSTPASCSRAAVPP